MRKMWHGAVLASTVLLLMGVAAPALADDLEDYLEKAADADYAGTRIVMTFWDGRSIAKSTFVEHSGDVMMLAENDVSAVIGDGRVAVDGSAGLVLSSWSTPALSVRYRTGEETDVTRLGRPARSITVLEGDLVRARIIFDLGTWAPLATEIYDDTGATFRLAAFTSFDANPRVMDKRETGYDYDLVRRLDASSLPATAGDYRQIDVYAGPGDTAQTFYSDGLFTFSVFELSSRQAQDQFRDAETFEAAGDNYLILVNPSDLWVMWERKGVAYVLIGDLPPDHLDKVLADLPSPKSKNLWERFWGFFG